MVDEDGVSDAVATPMDEVEPTPEAPSVGEQRAQIKAIMERKAFLEFGDVYYPINFRWWDTWRRYVGFDEENGSFVPSDDLHPGGIDNMGLRGDSDVEIDKRKLCDQDYYLLPEGAYHLLKQWYGGPGPDFMRRVVEIGNQKEAKVEVFPYFLYYSWADSQVLRGTDRMQTGASPLMAESTLEAEEAVKRVCVAAGLDLDLMSLYMVVEEEGDTGDDKGGKLEPIDLQSYKTRSLGDIFFGQHRVQLFLVDHRWRYALKEGDDVDAEDSDKAWYDSKVVKVVEADPIRGALVVKVHFKCWDSKWDEDMPVRSDKLEPPFSRAENWRVKMAEGYELEIKGMASKWYKGSIIEVDQAARRVKVACNELATNPTWQEWESEEICRLGVHIKASTSSTNLSALHKRPSTSTAIVPSTRTSPSSSGHVLGSPTAGSSRYSTPYGSGTMTSYGYNRPNTRGNPPEAGAVGLSNLGNTCFMNSMLQCLSNTTLLTSYFLQGRYEPEINERNPLGMKGQLAKVYASLMKDMWSGDFTTVAPTDFKRVISSFAPQFAGYQQHDSQELMNFLLDGLHEDLNRVRNKPYVEVKDFDNVPDEVAASEAWSRHLLRNDSVVIDHCQGQLKSHVTCPKCGYNSVTFDPYMSLSLPLPVMNTVKVTFRYFPLPYGAMPFRAVAQLPSQGTAKDLKAWIIEHFFTHDSPDPPQPSSSSSDNLMAIDSYSSSSSTFARPSSPFPPAAPVTPRQRVRSPATIGLDLTDNYDKRVFGHILDDDPISKVSKPQMDVHVYQLEFNPATDPAVGVLTVMFGKTRTTFGFPLNKAYERFGLPYRMAFKPGLTNRQIYLRVGRFVTTRVFRPDATVTDAERSLRIIYANTVGGTNDGDLPMDDDFFAIDPRKQALVVLFSQEMFAESVDKDWADRYTAHSSISRKDGGVPRKAIHVQDCFDKFTEREQLGAEDLWYCPKCKERLQAFKKMDVWSTPDVLILHLKRFSYVQQFFVTREKIEEVVSFPLEGLDLRPIIRGPIEPTAPPIYDLYAVSEHSGGLGGGHYTAVGRNFRNGKWYSFNDSYVNEISDESGLESHIITSRAYVLFYKRRAGELKWAGARPTATEAGAVKQENGTM